MFNIEEIRKTLTDKEGRATRKFSARLTETYHEVLSRLAALEGRSKTEVIKRALDAYVAAK